MDALVALDEAGYTNLVGLKGGYYAWNRCSSLSIARLTRSYILIQRQAIELLHFKAKVWRYSTLGNNTLGQTIRGLRIRAQYLR